MPNILSELINEAEENIEVLKFKEGYDRGDPCASLFNGIILQALIDICRDEDYTDSDKEEAMSWFFSTVVSIADNFETVCDLAGVETTKVRSFACRILKSDNKRTIRQQMSYFLHEEI